MPDLPQTWRMLRSSPAPGVENMATDMALLREVREPVLRLYAWSPPAISLGYHQKISEIDTRRCATLGIDVVRRPTGGRAILHAEELTYAVILPADHPWFADGVYRVYERISGALLQALQTMGLPAVLAAPESSSEKKYARRAACFARSVRHEISVHGRKMVGSAQRRFREGLLQHGSILTGPAHEQLEQLLMQPASPDAGPGLRQTAICMQDVLGRQPGLDEVVAAVISGFETFFQIELVESTLTQAETERREQEAQALAQTVPV